jgi:hypothetical protein
MLYFYFIKFIFFTFYYILCYSLQNYTCGHIDQDFIITTHYYIVFYRFDN